jgi:hypothetical protein
MSRKSSLGVLAAAVIALAGGAHATEVLFTITETGETVTFTLPVSPTSEIYYTSSGAGFSGGPGKH